MSFSKIIKTFLIDASPSKRLSCELSNWTGKAFKIPKSMVLESLKRNELHSPGVYILFGKDPEDYSENIAYIGESENVIERLKQHIKKEFWTEAVMIVSKDDNLNKAHIKYLEHIMYVRAVDCKRYTLDNSQIPKKSAISEPDTAEMNEFFYNIKLLVKALGYNIFEELSETTDDNSYIFHIKAAREADAQGQYSTEGFLVLEESKAAKETVPSMSQSTHNLREKLLKNGTLKDNGNSLIFTRNRLFTTPSTAAAVVMGRNANGKSEWKLKDGISINDLENK